MKFSEIRQTEWPSLMQYMDTCLLPVTGLIGTEQPWQAADKLERLRDLLDDIETPYNGRVVTYPAFHYTEEDTLELTLNQLCNKLKQGGFHYVIDAFLESGPAFLKQRAIAGCDLVVTEEIKTEFVRKQITAMWGKSPKIT